MASDGWDSDIEVQAQTVIPSRRALRKSFASNAIHIKLQNSIMNKNYDPNKSDLYSVSLPLQTNTTH